MRKFPDRFIWRYDELVEGEYYGCFLNCGPHERDDAVTKVSEWRQAPWHTVGVYSERLS
jgi:hypothetical protein